MGSMPDRPPRISGLRRGRGNPAIRKKLAEADPDKAGAQGHGDDPGRLKPGSIKAMHIMGENPVRAFPDSPRIEKAFPVSIFWWSRTSF